MTPSLLVVDLDGTALARDGRVSELDRRAARALRAAGVEVTIATGRLWAGAAQAAVDLGVTGSLALMNGSHRVDAESGRTLHADVFSADERQAVRQVLIEHGLPAVLFCYEDVHLDEVQAEFSTYLGIWTPRVRAHRSLHEAALWHEAPDLLSVGVIADGLRIDAAERALSARLSGPVGGVHFQTYAGQRFWSLRHTTHDKATALAALAADRGLEVSQVVAVGDWDNDLTMLKAAGLGFAMGGAGAEVVAAADHELVARRGEGGGIAELAARVWGVKV